MEQTTFDVLCNKHYTSVLRYMNHKYRDVGEDLTQDAFLRAREYLDKYVAGESGFKTWVINIGNNLAANMFRNKARREDKIEFVEVNDNECIDYTTPESLLLAKQLADRVEGYIDGMSDGRRELLESAERNRTGRTRHTLDNYTRHHLSKKLKEGWPNGC